MNNEPNSKIIGAFVVGFALVAGAYTLSSLQDPFSETESVSQQATAQNAVAGRVAIEVVDADNNGIEDWRDEFITAEPIIVDKPLEDYTPPTTVTGRLGINFMRDIVQAKTQQGFGRSDEQVIADTIESLRTETSHEGYDRFDIQIIQDWSDEDIRTYANSIALAILNNDKDLEYELLILQDILNFNQTERISELEEMALLYQATRDDTLAVPVPAFLAKEHLDLINTYHAVYNDVEAMTLSFKDPAYTLLRLKRYEEDVLGMRYALQNIYRALEPYASLFTANDPAVLFVQFSPTVQL